MARTTRRGARSGPGPRLRKQQAGDAESGPDGVTPSANAHCVPRHAGGGARRRARVLPNNWAWRPGARLVHDASLLLEEGQRN